MKVGELLTQMQPPKWLREAEASGWKDGPGREDDAGPGQFD